MMESARAETRHPTLKGHPRKGAEGENEALTDCFLRTQTWEAIENKGKCSENKAKRSLEQTGTNRKSSEERRDPTVLANRVARWPEASNLAYKSRPSVAHKYARLFYSGRKPLLAC